MKILKLIAFLGIATFIACGGDGGDDPGPPPVVEKVPEKATLVYPLNNEECVTGVNISATHSTVNFSWSPAKNATSYDLYIINLTSGAEWKYTMSETSTDRVIEKSTPYKWYVVSKSNTSTKTATSDTWKFYNSGPAETTYAPFPAEVIAPEMGQHLNATSVNLEWETSDVDGDLASFQVYFGTVNPPVDLLDEVTDTFINDVSVTPNTYYWMVKSIDEQGNSSNSGVFEFKISN